MHDLQLAPFDYIWLGFPAAEGSNLRYLPPRLICSFPTLQSDDCKTSNCLSARVFLPPASNLIPGSLGPHNWLKPYLQSTASTTARASNCRFRFVLSRYSRAKQYVSWIEPGAGIRDILLVVVDTLKVLSALQPTYIRLFFSIIPALRRKARSLSRFPPSPPFPLRQTGQDAPIAQLKGNSCREEYPLTPSHARRIVRRNYLLLTYLHHRPSQCQMPKTNLCRSILERK